MIGRIIVPVMAMFATVSCAGLVEHGRAMGGQLPGPATPVALRLASGAGDRRIADGAQAALSRALVRHGYVVTPDAADRIELAVSLRPSALALEDSEGHVLSPALSRDLLQSCYHQTARLVIATYRQGASAATGRASAERASCHGDWDQTLDMLAEQLVSQMPAR